MLGNVFQEVIDQWKVSESSGLLGNLEKIVVSVLGIVGFLVFRPDFVMLSVLKPFRINSLAR